MRSRAVKAHRTMHPAPFLRRVYRIDQNDLTIAHEVLSSRRSTSVLLTQSDATMMATSGGLPLITTQLRGHVQSPNHTFVPYDGWANLMHKLGFQHPVSTSPNYSVTVATAPTWLRVRALEHVSEIMHVNFDGLGAFRCMLRMATMAKVPLTDDIRCLSEYTTNCESRDSAHDIHDPVHDNQKGQSSSPAHDNSNVTCRIMAVGCGCGLMAAPDRSQTPLVFFADRPWWRHVGRQTHGYWLWLRSNGCARPQSDRRFSWVLSLGTKKKILGGSKFFSSVAAGFGCWLGVGMYP